MYIFSVDCGIKNLAYSCIFLKNVDSSNLPKFFEMNEYRIIDIQNVSIDESNNMYDNTIKMLLNVIDNIDINEDINVLIERQMNINSKTNKIYNIIYTFFKTYYILKNKTNYNIVSINPMYKNILSQHVNVNKLDYSSTYTYNKKIVKTNFTDLNNKHKFINTVKIKKLDDIADSFIQILSYFAYYHNK